MHAPRARTHTHTSARRICCKVHIHLTILKLLFSCNESETQYANMTGMNTFLRKFIIFPTLGNIFSKVHTQQNVSN